MDYMIPANAKKSQLIFSIFRLIDVVILATGICISLILMFIFKGDTVTELVFKLAPGAISCILVMPVSFYHNVSVFLREAYQYYTGQTRYIWRGWCAWYVGDDEQT